MPSPKNRVNNNFKASETGVTLSIAAEFWDPAIRPAV
jgi:hypothetical protein